MTLIIGLTFLLFGCNPDTTNKTADKQANSLTIGPNQRTIDTVKGVICGTALNEKSAQEARELLEKIAKDSTKTIKK